MVVMHSRHNYVPIVTVLLSFVVMTSSLSSKLNLIVGLNPALQRIVHVPDLIVGDVNRGQKVDVGIGGKGQNVIVAANCMQTVSNYRPALLQLLGKGAEGDQVLELLRPLIDKKMEKLSVRPSIRCRTCITLVDPVKQETTEIIEPSDPMAIEEVEYMINTVTETFVVDKVGGIAIMGSMPPGCPPTTYRSVVSATCDVNSKVILNVFVVK